MELQLTFVFVSQVSDSDQNYQASSQYYTEQREILIGGNINLAVRATSLRLSALDHMFLLYNHYINNSLD